MWYNLLSGCLCEYRRSAVDITEDVGLVPTFPLCMALCTHPGHETERRSYQGK